MRIAYIANSIIPSPFANSIQVMKMCEGFSKLGHVVTLFIRKPPGIIENNRDIHADYGVEKTFEIKQTSAHRKFLHSMISSIITRWQNFDLCITRSSQAALATSALGIETVFEIHRPFESSLGKRLAPTLFNSPKIRVVTISKALREYCIEHYRPTDTKRLAFFHDGAELVSFEIPQTKAELRREMGLPIDEKIIGYSGSLYRGRGIELLISISKMLPINCTTVIAGGREDDLTRLKKLAAETEASKIIFLGHIPIHSVPKFLRACDVLVMPYERQAHDVSGSVIGSFMSPLKMFEYMASGIPIAAADLPVLGEVLVDNSNALLFEPGSTDKLYEAITNLLEDEAKGHKIAQRAREDVEQYSWQKRAKAIIEFAGF